MLYANALLDADAMLPSCDDHENWDLYVSFVSIEVLVDVFEVGLMMVFRSGDSIPVKALPMGGNFMAFDGEILNGPRHFLWNFIVPSQDKIEMEKVAWAAWGWAHVRFQLPQDNNVESVPMP